MVSVTALVCTRNRSTQIVNAVRSLLDSGPEVELIVVDQSSNEETRDALSQWADEPRLRYHHTTTTGKGAGLNEGMRLARGSVFVFTDDDCEVPSGWAAHMAQMLLGRPQVAVLFCNVAPVPHDRSAGYVPTYEISEPRLLTSVSQVGPTLGLGAGMAVRRDVALQLGGFDESFGPGARFPSADEWDMCIRALLCGWHVYETPEVAVVHDGFRTFEEGRSHARRDWLALGAVCAKPLRAGRLRGGRVALNLFPSKALWPPIADVLQLRRPRGVGRIAAFLDGFRKGMGLSVDPRTLHYVTGK